MDATTKECGRQDGMDHLKLDTRLKTRRIEAASLPRRWEDSFLPQEPVQVPSRPAIKHCRESCLLFRLSENSFFLESICLLRIETYDLMRQAHLYSHRNPRLEMIQDCKAFSRCLTIAWRKLKGPETSWRWRSLMPFRKPKPRGFGGGAQATSGPKQRVTDSSMDAVCSSDG
jgi:hypothetical protein